MLAGLGEIDRLHLAAGGAGLDGHQRVAEHLLRVIERLGLGSGDFHAALETVGKGALAAPAGVDLRFYDNEPLGKSGEGRREIGGGAGRHALRHGDAMFFQQGLGLVFVDVHR